MSLWPTVIGAALGLAFALFANVFVLPFVLRKQVERPLQLISTPFGQFDLAHVTTLAYRIVFPVLFGIVGAVGANKVAGGFSP